MDERRESRFERGLALLDGGHYEEARSYLAESLEKEGYSEECYVSFLDVCTLLKERFPDHEAVEEADTQDDSLQEAGRIAMEEGIRHLEKGRYGRAIHKLREVVETGPQIATDALLKALHKKAKQYIERKLFRKAILLYDECLKLGDSSSQTYYLRAWTNLHAGNIVQAQMDMRRAQQLVAVQDQTSLTQRRIQNGEDEAGAPLSNTVSVTSTSVERSLQTLTHLISQ